MVLSCSFIFGAITCVTGLLGVVIGAATTRFCRQRTERADPLVCAVSMLGSAIFICLIFVVAKKNIAGAYVSSTLCTVMQQFQQKRLGFKGTIKRGNSRTDLENDNDDKSTL